MRLASISKSITAIAIMKLVEEKKLNLNDEVFGETGIFKGGYGIPEFENHPVKITVKQLLEHTAGGWGNSNRDPVSNIAREKLIQTTIRDYPLERFPGTKYDYSNFGYWVLGRVIEKQSGMTYEDYVKENILKPCGINGMRIGDAIYRTDEAECIGDKNVNPYMSPSHRDANGGWIANPIELLKLLARVDGFSTVPDILKSETIRIMTTPSKQNPNYALGWFVNQSNIWWHTGSRSGVRTRMTRDSNGFNWVVLINSFPPADGDFIRDRDKLFWQIKSIIQEWPTGTELYDSDSKNPRVSLCPKSRQRRTCNPASIHNGSINEIGPHPLCYPSLF